MSQLYKELFLISIVVVLTVAAYFKLRNHHTNTAQTSEKIVTGFLGSFLILGGTAKFFEPFTTMFASQITLSELPLPGLSAIAGQFGEIITGVTLLVLLPLGQRLASVTTDRLFYLVNMVVGIIMLVAVYVHLHPAVPAEVLPLASKPPYLTLFIMTLVGLNCYLHYSNQKKQILIHSL